MFQIDPKQPMPLYEQIIQQVKEMYAKGLLKPNEKLPSVRELASHMVINPNTVSKAYQELERQGIIATIRGRGTFIVKQDIKPAPPTDITRLKDTLKQVVINCYYAGYFKNDLIEWLEDIYTEMEEIADED
ncbi:GntR family transcriptional regulator [Salipaludibacillus agaradhaerens]|uniref:GntR family transcriptional regulator n=1 Tax=Salipaludibacillus agaradhaerens TaxID=76935 RepID=UPI002151D1CB|nr:GntR family transcriptional regulator [Salipaludibacillus agaradhaerens]MCR6106118.1 GntR family transcriptional regulator [Salipaludibacillus agaradhaerens]MCR6118151.1 GntR family transcriptional regulator [Salipaludibacillus agaradhaerens]